MPEHYAEPDGKNWKLAQDVMPAAEAAMAAEAMVI
eukprot:CAMPEP_0172875036 /NCGR_PEP_ID=MMETSP1075-20121228/100270_1 /TAXON_ID=2916 /ORGANISM="Ceratium fusus, Strain PA161109" /LENGTH=34 /DNA_ID= /DNA_START= /DNA_END= /DNA_ORIENTATION=